jgi:hypothetical protein
MWWGRVKRPLHDTELDIKYLLEEDVFMGDINSPAAKVNLLWRYQSSSQSSRYMLLGGLLQHFDIEEYCII